MNINVCAYVHFAYKHVQCMHTLQHSMQTTKLYSVNACIDQISNGRLQLIYEETWTDAKMPRHADSNAPSN